MRLFSCLELIAAPIDMIADDLDDNNSGRNPITDCLDGKLLRKKFELLCGRQTLF
jgi:hypothetical protein